MGLPVDIRMLQVSNDDMAPYVSRDDVVIYDPRVNSIQSNGVYVLQVRSDFSSAACKGLGTACA